MADHVRYVLEALRDSGEFTLYRGHEPDEPASVLIVAPATEQPSSQSLRQLEPECSLAADLDPASAARPIEVTRRDGPTMLILEDPGGEPLDRILERSEGQPLELTRVSRIAVRLATALGRVHRQDLIHKTGRRGRGHPHGPSRSQERSADQQLSPSSRQRSHTCVTPRNTERQVVHAGIFEN